MDLIYDESSVESEAYDYTDDNEFNVKSDSGELDEEEVMALKVFKKVKKIEQEENERVAAQLESNRRQIKRKETNADHFQAYCSQQNLEAKRRFMKKMKAEKLEASITEVDDEDLEEEEETVVEAHEEEDEETIDEVVDNIVNVKSGDSQLNALEQLARLGDKSLLVERLEVEEGKAKRAAVEEYVASLDVAAEGKVEKVVDVETKKKMLLVQFDSMTYRDAVLKASRSPGARYDQHT